MTASGKEKKEGIVKENRINMYTLLYFKWIIKKVLLYRRRELHSVLCGSLDGRGIWGGRGMDTGICMAESLPCPPETVTTLLVSYTPI